MTVSIAYSTGLKQRTSPSPQVSRGAPPVAAAPGAPWLDAVSSPLVAYTSPLPLLARSAAW
jgi:hypothetical protein